VRETGGEDRHASRGPVRAQVDLDHAAAEALAQVLAPLGDEEVAAPEGEAVRGGVRLEVGGRLGDARAAPAQPQRARVRPAARPAVERPLPHHDHNVGRLGIARRAELVLAVDRGVEAACPRLEGEAVRVAQAASTDAQIGAVGPQRQHGGAAPVALRAGVAGRAAAPPEAAAVEDDVVLLVLAEREALHDHPPADEAAAAEREPLQPALLGDEEVTAVPSKPERRAEPADEHGRPARSAPDRNERAAGLGHVDAAVRPVRHRGRLREAAREGLDAEVRGHFDALTRPAGPNGEDSCDPG
jgi:hypothetical protein